MIIIIRNILVNAFFYEIKKSLNAVYNYHFNILNI